MAFDVKNFAAELGLPDEGKAALFGLFEKHPAALGKLESVFTREIDSRLTPLKTELETKQRDLDAQFETLASIRSTDSDAFDRLQKQMEKTASEKAVLETRFRKVATENGLDAEALLKDITSEAVVVPPKSTVETPIDVNKILGQANLAALNAFEQSALLEDLAAEHQNLFGKPMSRAELIGALKETVKRTGNTNLGLRDVFEQKYNVAAKREELREADVQRRIEQAVSTAKTAMADEMALRPGSASPTSSSNPSPIFGAIKPIEGQPPVHVQGLPEGVVASMAAYRAMRQAAKAS